LRFIELFNPYVQRIGPVYSAFVGQAREQGKRGLVRMASTQIQPLQEMNKDPVA